MKRCGFLPFFSKNCKIQQCLMVFCVSKFQKNGQIYGFHWTLSSNASQLTQLNPKTAKTSTFSITIGMGCRPRYQGLLSPNLELKSLQVHPVFPFFPLFLVRFFSPLPFPILCPLSSLSLSLSLFSSPSRSVTPSASRGSMPLLQLWGLWDRYKFPQRVRAVCGAFWAKTVSGDISLYCLHP